MHFLRRHIDTCAVAVPADAGVIGADAGWRVLPEPGPVITLEAWRLDAAGFVENRPVEAVQIALRRPVHLADPEGVVAGIAERLGQRLRIMLRHFAVTEQPVVPRIQARE